MIELGAISVDFRVEHAAMSVFEVAVKGGGKVPAPHSHDAFEELIYGLEGTTTFTVGDVVHELGPGEAVLIERGVVHGFEALDGDMKFLAIATPGVFGSQYFLDLQQVMRDAAGGPPDLQQVMAVMTRHGLTPAPPPA